MSETEKPLSNQINYFDPKPPAPQSPVQLLASMIVVEVALGIVTKRNLDDMTKRLEEQINNFLEQRDKQS